MPSKGSDPFFNGLLRGLRELRSIGRSVCVGYHLTRNPRYIPGEGMDIAISRDRLMSHPAAGELCGEFLPLLVLELPEQQLATQLLDVVRQKTGCASASIASPCDGRWELFASTKTIVELPVELLAEALDTSSIVDREPHLIAPLDHWAASGEVLLLEGVPASATPRDTLVNSLAEACGLALKVVRRSTTSKNVVENLESQVHRAMTSGRSGASGDSPSGDLNGGGEPIDARLVGESQAMQELRSRIAKLGALGLVRARDR